MEEWKEVKLGEITLMKNGKKRPVNKGVYPVFGGNGIMDTADIFNAENVIVVGRVGAYCGNVYKYFDKCWVSDNAISVSPKENVDISYLYYLMSTLDLHHHHIGAAQPLMTQDIIGNFNINIPPLPTQQKIANILSSLDDKIEVNRRINENLEAQAQALFKSWFVDFEPFKDGEFVESELGMIPKGWRVKRLEEVSKLIAGGDKPDVVSLNKTDDTPYAIYSNGIDNYGLYGFSDNYRIKEESVTVSARGTIGYVCLREEPYTPIVRLISVIPDTNFVSAKYMYHALKIKPIQGTGTTQQQLTVPMFRNTLLVIPSQELMDSFTIKVNSMFELRRNNQQEITRLASLRDTLLPKLMSGEVDVNDVNI